MALLLILLALFGFVFTGFGSGSSTTSGSVTVEPQAATSHVRPPKLNRCSNRMTAEPGVDDSGQCRHIPAHR